MRLVRLHTKGFMIYRHELTVEFSPGVTYIVAENLDHPEHADSNGAGKTTVLYAIIWLLWGKIPADHVKNDLIHMEAPGVYGELELEGDGEFLKIVRSKSREGSEKLTWNLNGKVHELDMPVAQTKLEANYGVSFDTFCNSVFIAPYSKATQFVQAPPAQRAKILAELIDDAVFQEAAKRIQKDLSQAENQIAVNNSILSRIESEQGRCQTEILRLEAQIKQESLRVQEQASADQKAIMKLMEEQALLQRELNTPSGPVNITDMQVEISQLQQENRELAMRLGALQSAQGSKSFSPGDTCPTCRQMVDHTHIAHLESLREENRGKAAEVSRLLERNNRRISELEDSKTRAQSGILERRRKEDRVKDLQAQIVSLRSRGEARNSVDVLLVEKQKHSENYQNLKKEAEENRRATALLQNRIPSLKILKNGFQVEIRDMMFDDLRQVLSYYTDKYRWLLAGGEFQIEFPVERGRFDIVMKVNGVKKPLPSTGENWRATFSILLSLRRALTYGNRTIFDFLLVDDPFQGGLDDTGIRVFSRLLEALGREIPQTLVTLPRRVQDMADGKVLTARRQNRASQLIGG